jgi:hypothetical protein
MHELAGSDLPLTQDFLAQMMGGMMQSRSLHAVPSEHARR